MNRMLLIARFEYLRQLRRRGFLLTTFGAPLALGLLFAALIFFIVSSDSPEQAIGYIDQTGLVQPGTALPLEDNQQPVPLRPFADERSAGAAFAAGEIDAYVVLPPDYLDTGAVLVYGRGDLSEVGDDSMRALLRGSLLASEQPAVRVRAAAPLEELLLGDTQSDRTLTSAESLLLFIFPFLFGLLFSFVTFSSSGYLLQAVVDEKENRTMELILTSVTPRQLLGGKVIGLAALGLTQASIWLGYLALLVAVGRVFLEPLRTLQLPGGVLLVAALAFVPGYVLFAGIMVAIGSMVSSAQEGQQYGSLVTLVGVLPFMLNFAIVSNPNGPVATALTLFPLTAPLTLMMRLPLTSVPPWQIALSLLLLVVSAALVVLAAARIFRIGMLHYGKALRLRELFALLK